MAVLDLTIDCNYAGVRAAKGVNNLTLAAVSLSGHHSRIERVRAINAAGLRPAPNDESFILTLGLDASDHTNPATGLLIRDCEVASFAGGECSAISFWGGGGSTGTSGIIQNNRVYLN